MKEPEGSVVLKKLAKRDMRLAIIGPTIPKILKLKVC